MSYRFNGTNQDIRFSIGAFSGYIGPLVFAIYLKRNAFAAWMGAITVSVGVTTAVRSDSIEFDPTNKMSYWPGGGSTVAVAAANTDPAFQLVVLTANPNLGVDQPRFHTKSLGGAWAHANTSATTSSSGTAFGATDQIIIGTDPSGGDDLNADVVAVAGKKFVATPSDVAVEALFSDVDFTVWQGAALDWLVGFDAIGTRSDLTGGGGNEVARNGTPTLVSDPAGWSFTGGAAAVIPDVNMAPMIPS